MMSICTDAQGRVTGVCPDNLTGGEGWAWMETKLTPMDNLTDENGVPLYKIVKGEVVARTKKEIDADKPKAEVDAKTEYAKAKSTTEKLEVLARAVFGGM